MTINERAAKLFDDLNKLQSGEYGRQSMIDLFAEALSEAVTISDIPTRITDLEREVARLHECNNQRIVYIERLVEASGVPHDADLTDEGFVEALATLRRERDEARSRSDTFQEECARLMRERDEARAILEQVKRGRDREVMDRNREIADRDRRIAEIEAALRRLCGSDDFRECGMDAGMVYQRVEQIARAALSAPAQPAIDPLVAHETARGRWPMSSPKWDDAQPTTANECTCLFEHEPGCQRTAQPATATPEEIEAALKRGQDEARRAFPSRGANLAAPPSPAAHTCTLTHSGLTVPPPCPGCNPVQFTAGVFTTNGAPPSPAARDAPPPCKHGRDCRTCSDCIREWNDSQEREAMTHSSACIASVTLGGSNGCVCGAYDVPFPSHVGHFRSSSLPPVPVASAVISSNRDPVEAKKP